jgi:hypothetical protein
MKTLTIRVPYTPTRPGIDGPDGQPVGHVHVRLHAEADLERFEDAAGEAEGDLAAALLLERQAELAAAAGLSWVEATTAMRAHAIRDADLALSAGQWAGQVKQGKDEKRAANRASRDAAAENGEERLDKLAPWFEKADAHLVAINSGQRGKQRLHTETEKLLLAEQKKQEPRSEKYRALAGLLGQLSIAYADRWIKERRRIVKT